MPPQAVAVAEKMGYTRTASWRRGNYVNTRPGPRLVELLKPYRMSKDRWWASVVGESK